MADYNGERSAKGITDAVKELIPNHVKRLADQDLESWLSKENDTAKAILFSDKGTTSALMKALSTEFLGTLHMAQVREKEKNAISTFGISKFPTLVVLPGGTTEPAVYEGELAKAPMTKFLGQYAAAAPADTSSKSATKDTKSTTTVSDTDEPTESPEPFVGDDTQKPIVVPDLPPPLPSLESELALQSACLGPRTHTCILAILPAPADAEAILPEQANTALASLSELAQKHKTRGSKLFPFFAVPASNPGVKALQSGLGLIDGEVEVLAVNGRRSWWRHFAAEKGFGVMELESWIDGIRLGEGKKEKLPESLIVEPEPTEEPAPETAEDATSKESAKAEEPEESVAESAEPLVEEPVPAENSAEEIEVEAEKTLVVEKTIKVEDAIPAKESEKVEIKHEDL